MILAWLCRFNLILKSYNLHFLNFNHGNVTYNYFDSLYNTIYMFLLFIKTNWPPSIYMYIYSYDK